MTNRRATGKPEAFSTTKRGGEHMTRAKSTVPPDSATLGLVSDNTPMITSEVAKALRVSASRVHELDHRLKPERTPSGVRVYRSDAVEAELDRRVARALAKKGPAR